MICPSKKLLLCFCLCFGFIEAAAQYRFDHWTTDDGLPQDSVYAVTQTRDGYLWFGTIVGLVRFDGVDFTVFDSLNTPQIKSNVVIALLEDRHGNLWIGTEDGGLTRRTGDKFFHYSQADGLPDDDFISCLLEAADGSIWIGSHNGGLSVWRDGQLKTFTVADGLPGNRIRSLAQDAAGRIWIGTTNGLSHWQDGRFTNYSTADGLNHDRVDALYWNQIEGLIIGTGQGLNRWQNGQLTRIVTGTEADRTRIRSILAVSSEVWIGTQGKGLYHRPQGQTLFEQMPGADSDITIFSLYQDSDNTILAATFGRGVYRFRKQQMHTFTAAEGFPGANVSAIYEARNGDLWFGGAAPLHRLRYGAITVYSPQQSLNSDVDVIVGAMTEDAAGNVWFGGRPGILIFDGSKFVSLKTKDVLSDKVVASLLHDHAGNLWIGTLSGLYKWRDGHFTDYNHVPAVANKQILRLFADSRGALWIGTNKGLNRMQHEQVTPYPLGNSAAHNRITALYEDGAGALWIGTTGGGLFRYQHEKFTNITSRDGLYDNHIYTLLESDGDFWITGERGIFRVSIGELNELADGQRQSVNSYSYGVEDGILGRGTDSLQQAGLKARDGMLWFATVKGVVRIDPRPRNAHPPSVLIEWAKLDNATHTNVETLDIEPEDDNLEIKYTAISWPRSRQIKFKYRMHGLESAWTEAGTRRTAYFPYLPPGAYTFQVIADNGEGVWNEQGATLKIIVLPPFYRTWWFLILAVFVIAALAFLFFRRRVAQINLKHAAELAFSRRLIDSQEQERKRIAAEMHDGLGQSLVIIKNRARLSLKQSDKKEAMLDHLENISETASHAIEEAREIAFNLRPHLLDRLGLTKTIESMLDKVFSASGIEFEAEIDLIDGFLEKDSEILLYRIVQECANNIVKHSNATKAILRIERDEKNLSVKISDDGRGFDLATGGNDLSKRSFGLVGLAERTRLLGGKLNIESQPGKGTIVSIDIIGKENIARETHEKH